MDGKIISVKQMVCVNNIDYEDCMTIDKSYEVTLRDFGGQTMYSFLDDNNEPLQTLAERFIDDPANH